MFIDEVTITVKAGNGGDGAVSFRREKFVPKGGPDGGDGGKGGDVYLKASSSTHGLTNYKGKKRFEAPSGKNGYGNRSSGHSGEDLILTVPPGTRISSTGSEEVIADLTSEGTSILIAKAGKGGKGNWHFRGPTNQTPRQFEHGGAGEEKELKLELQLIADVGLVGLPNAGKSTLLATISNARPKIADYPFTTLEPNLGMVNYHDKQFVVADIPGLIEGAAKGKGLGHAFLKHILRTNTIIHLIPATEDDPRAIYQSVRKELGEYDETLLKKKEIVVLSKIDLVPDWQQKHSAFIKKHHTLGLSAVTNKGINELLTEISKELS